MSAVNTIRVGVGLAAILVAFWVHAAPSKQAPAKSKTLFRWVDADGQVHYGDKVPPQDAKQGRESINRQGTVTKVVPRELNGSELEREQARLAAEKAAEEARQQRIIYDRYLVQSFASVADLQAAREERMGSVESRLTLAEAAVLENEKTLADLRSRVGANAATGKLKSQIETFENSLIDNLQAVRRLRQERSEVATKYAADIERFKGLRAGTIRQGE